MKQVKFKDCVGKTIQASDEGSESFIIVFTDQTFVRFRLVGGEFPYLDEEEVNLDYRRPYSIPDPSTLIALGILNQEEYDRAEAAYMLEHRAREQKYKLQQYENLKKELGL